MSRAVSLFHGRNEQHRVVDIGIAERGQNLLGRIRRVRRLPAGEILHDGERAQIVGGCVHRRPVFGMKEPGGRLLEQRREALLVIVHGRPHVLALESAAGNRVRLQKRLRAENLRAGAVRQPGQRHVVQAGGCRPFREFVAEQRGGLVKQERIVRRGAEHRVAVRPADDHAEPAQHVVQRAGGDFPARRGRQRLQYGKRIIIRRHKIPAGGDSAHGGKRPFQQRLPAQLFQRLPRKPLGGKPALHDHGDFRAHF